MKSIHLPLTLMLVFCILMITGCTPKPQPAGTTKFTSVIQGDSFTPPVSAEKPSVVVASDANQLAGLVPGLVDESTIKQLEKAIQEGNLVVVFFGGQQVTSGYRITVQSLKVENDQVNVIAELTDPAKDQNVNQVISYPYQVIQVAKDLVPDGAQWKLFDTQGKLIAETTPKSGVPTKGPIGGQVKFESVNQGDTPTPPQPVETPTLFIASDSAQAVSFLPSPLDPAINTQLQQGNKQGMLTVAVYRGMMPTSGYGITVLSIAVEGNQVKVEVMFTDTSPGQMVNTVISYPYHILLVPQDQVPSITGTVWTLVDAKGTTLSQTVYP